MKKFACGDVVPGCGATFEGSEESILAEVTAHARDDHGMQPTPQLEAAVRANLR